MLGLWGKDFNMKTSTLWILISLASALACSAVGPGPNERPGDEQTEAWTADPKPPPDCTERWHVPCPEGVIEGDLQLEHNCSALVDCEVRGQVTIGRPPTRTNQIDPEQSRQPDYVRKVRGHQPKGVLIFRSKVIGPDGRVAVYVAPGVTYFRIEDSEIISRGHGGPTIYLDAESSRGVIEDSDIDARGSAREAIAVDGSDFNTIRGNRISGGSIKLYRNCGEGGVTRHTTPSDNWLQNNTFDDLAPIGIGVAVHLSSRDGMRGFCDLDDGLADVGSAQSNLDWARRNRVEGTKGGIVLEGFSASENEIK